MAKRKVRSPLGTYSSEVKQPDWKEFQVGLKEFHDLLRNGVPTQLIKLYNPYYESKTSQEIDKSVQEYKDNLKDLYLRHVATAFCSVSVPVTFVLDSSSTNEYVQPHFVIFPQKANYRSSYPDYTALLRESDSQKMEIDKDINLKFMESFVAIEELIDKAVDGMIDGSIKAVRDFESAPEFSDWKWKNTSGRWLVIGITALYIVYAGVMAYGAVLVYNGVMAENAAKAIISTLPSDLLQALSLKYQYYMTGSGYGSTLEMLNMTSHFNVLNDPLLSESQKLAVEQIRVLLDELMMNAAPGVVLVAVAFAACFFSWMIVFASNTADKIKEKRGEIIKTNLEQFKDIFSVPENFKLDSSTIMSDDQLDMKKLHEVIGVEQQQVEGGSVVELSEEEVEPQAEVTIGVKLQYLAHAISHSLEKGSG